MKRARCHAPRSRHISSVQHFTDQPATGQRARAAAPVTCPPRARSHAHAHSTRQTAASLFLSEAATLVTSASHAHTHARALLSPVPPRSPAEGDLGRDGARVLPLCRCSSTSASCRSSRGWCTRNTSLLREDGEKEALLVPLLSPLSPCPPSAWCSSLPPPFSALLFFFLFSLQLFPDLF